MEGGEITLSDDFIDCPVCAEPFIVPVVCPCGHSLCGECCFKIQQCPICRMDFVEKDLIRNYDLERAVSFVHTHSDEHVRNVQTEVEKRIHPRQQSSSSQVTHCWVPDTVLFQRKNIVEDLKRKSIAAYESTLIKAVDNVLNRISAMYRNKRSGFSETFSVSNLIEKSEILTIPVPIFLTDLKTALDRIGVNSILNGDYISINFTPPTEGRT